MEKKENLKEIEILKKNQMEIISEKYCHQNKNNNQSSIVDKWWQDRISELEDGSTEFT